MESPWTTENHGGGRERAIEELVKGKDLLIRLKNLLELQHLGSDGYEYDSTTMELLAGIARSFTTAISMLSPDPAGKGSQISDSTLDRKSIISDVSSKPPPPPAVKDRRGCYKRRKNEDSWQNVSSTIEDGYAWRKYGQKDILKFNFPRCYYRCTHKYDQGCKAIKQIQKMQDEPLRYKTMYFGLHTCTTTTTRPDSFNAVFDYQLVDPRDESCQFVSFESYNPTDHPLSKQAAINNNNLPVKEEPVIEEPTPDSVAWEDFAQIESLSRNKTYGLGFDQIMSQNVDFSSSSNYSFSDFKDSFEFDENTNYFLVQ